MKTECLIMVMNSILKGKRFNSIYIFINLLTTERNIVKNIFNLLNVLFNKCKNFDHYGMYLANNKEQYSLSLGNDYTEKDISTRLKEDKSAQRMIHGIVEEMEESGEGCKKYTIKLL